MQDLPEHSFSHTSLCSHAVFAFHKQVSGNLKDVFFLMGKFNDSHVSHTLSCLTLFCHATLYKKGKIWVIVGMVHLRLSFQPLM